MMNTFFLRTASFIGLSAAVIIPSAAYAQSTGSVDFEEGQIVVLGQRDSDVGGVDIPQTPKAKQVLTEEIIRRQRPGQTVNDMVNLIPGVSFQNNDPWGSAGGAFTIRGFGADRISQTVDGVPLNDSGNYALYTNQQLDPEVLESVNVNLGVTDVDSPTASAVGGTINIRSRKPSEEFGITSTSTIGDVFADGSGGTTDRSRLYMRQFLMVNTGDLTGMGTKAWVSASYTRYNNPFNNYGRNQKKQLNGRIQQDIGGNGDFIAISGHYNENRNNFFGSVSSTSFPMARKARFYNINFPCTTDTPEPGVADKTNSCGTEFDRRYNPSNTGNIRISSRFTLTDKLTLSVDPSYQYVKANGGGTTTAYEYARNGFFGYIAGRPYVGLDLNGDGDTKDAVTVLAPSHTRTHRYGVIANIAYELNADNTIRLSYTHDNANHRQTGAITRLLANGEPEDVFPINNPIVDVNGNVLMKRDRQSYAILNQVSGEYRGIFGEFTAVLGGRMPFFKRELNNYCFTTSASGNVDCLGGGNFDTAYGAANPRFIAPVSRTYNYKKFLPNIGFTYDLGAGSVFGNYAKGLSVPGTDPLYNSLYFSDTTQGIKPAPETTDSFDLGLRMRRGGISAQLAGWFTKYHNRLASSFDPVLNETIYRNLGTVDKYGIDGSISWQVNNNALIYVFGSYKTSDIKANVQTGATTSQPTAGKQESGSANTLFGARGQLRFGDFEFGAQAKRTGSAWINDINTAKLPGYTLVDLDMRYRIADFVTGGNVAVQFNVTNLFDKVYSGRLSGLSATSGFVQIGAPRAASMSLVIGY